MVSHQEKKSFTLTRTSFIIDTFFSLFFIWNILQKTLLLTPLLLLFFPIFLIWQFFVRGKIKKKIKRLRAYRHEVISEIQRVYTVSTILFLIELPVVHAWIMQHVLEKTFFYMQIFYVLFMSVALVASLNIVYIKIYILRVWGPQKQK